MTVKNIEEAGDWFLRNSSGNLLCERQDGTTKECDCYPVAKEFFKEE